MVNESNFIIRVSGRRDKSCYIDYQGVYKINEIARIVGSDPQTVKEKYLSHGAAYDQNVDVYYFNCADAAKKTIEDILANLRMDLKGKMLFLTEAEVEYIRKALINEGANTIHVKNRIKDEIFRKLNA